MDKRTEQEEVSIMQTKLELRVLIGFSLKIPEIPATHQHRNEISTCKAFCQLTLPKILPTKNSLLCEVNKGLSRHIPGITCTVVKCCETFYPFHYQLPTSIISAQHLQRHTLENKHLPILFMPCFVEEKGTSEEVHILQIMFFEDQHLFVNMSPMLLIQAEISITGRAHPDILFSPFRFCSSKSAKSS